MIRSRELLKVWLFGLEKHRKVEYLLNIEVNLVANVNAELHLLVTRRFIVSEN